MATTVRDALNQTLNQLMAADDRIILLGEDIVGGDGDTELGGPFGITKGLAGRFGRERVIDAPISETAFVGMAVGAAMTGLKPIVEVMFCDFMGVCFDQIVNQAAKARFLSAGRLDMPLVIRTTMGAGDGSGAMHSQSFYGLLMGVPGLTVACPATPGDAAGLLKSAVATPGPVVLMEHKGLYDLAAEVDESLPPIPIGRGEIVRRGSDITIVAVGALRHTANEAATTLAERGVNAEVIDPRTIKPFDLDLINDSVAKTGHLLVVSEDGAVAGFADAVVSAVVRSNMKALDQPPVVVTPPDTPVPYGRLAERHWVPSVQSIETAATALVGGDA